MDAGGAARPGPGGEAQVRSGASPGRRRSGEVVVTRAVDDATSIPHGEPVLQWFDASWAHPGRARSTSPGNPWRKLRFYQRSGRTSQQHRANAEFTSVAHVCPIVKEAPPVTDSPETSST